MPIELVSPLRTSCALSTSDAVRLFWVGGDGAHDLLDRLCPGELFLRDGQLLHGLMLDGDGVPAVDLYVCRDDDAFLLIGEERPGFAMEAHLRAAATSNVSVNRLDTTHQLLSIDGPYAWEVMVELAGPSVIGLPYLNLFHGEGWECFRAGKTGEYGYTLIVERSLAAALRARIEEAGRAFDLGSATSDDLELCALENGFFNIRREGTFGLTPLELQLQWRTSRRKKGFLGAEALQARRESGFASRITWIASERALAVGMPVQAQELVIGQVLSAGHSAALGMSVGVALLALAFAYPGTDTYTAGPERARLITVAPPVLQNRSLFVSPQRDSNFTRTTRTFPPLVPGRET